MTHNIENPQKNGVTNYAQFYSIRENLHSKGYFIHPITWRKTSFNIGLADNSVRR